MGIFIKNLASEGMSYEEYLAYIESIKDQLPQPAYEYAKASWHYDMKSPRCIHDAWLLSSIISEASIESPKLKPTRFGLEISFLGGFEDRILKYSYGDIVSYHFETPDRISAHSEVYFDEIRLSEQGNVVHEILFMTNVRWITECKIFNFIEERPTIADKTDYP